MLPQRITAPLGDDTPVLCHTCQNADLRALPPQGSDCFSLGCSWAASGEFPRLSRAVTASFRGTASPGPRGWPVLCQRDEQ